MPQPHPSGSRPFALAVWVTVAVLAGMTAFTASAGLVDTMPLAWAAAAAGAAASVWGLRRPAVDTILAAASPGSQRWFMAGAAAVVGQLLILSMFIVDPNVAVWPDSAWRPWQSRHSCVSAYWVAARAAAEAPDLYREAVYRPPVLPNVPRPPNLGPFYVDVFEYPPTFLPLPRLLRAATADFWGFRRLWFALNLAGVVIGLVVVARRVDCRLGTQALWFVPFALAAPSVIGTLQVGNVQLLVLVASAVAMWLFERRRHVAGALLLGYAIVSKLYPGALVLYLLLRRDWRAVGWTTVAGGLFAVITLADVGWTPVAAFLDHLPKLLSGEAFPGLYRPASIAVNESIPGLVFKLGLYGVPNMGFPASRLVGWAYTLVVIGATAWLALRHSDRTYDPLAWIAILILATLRSPFLPHYGAFPSLWLAALLAARAWPRPALRAVTLGLWLVLAASVGQSGAPPQVNAVVTFTHTLAALVLVFAILPRVAPVAEGVEDTGSATPVPA